MCWCLSIIDMNMTFKFVVHLDKSFVEISDWREGASCNILGIWFEDFPLLRLIQDRVKCSRTGNSFSEPLGSGNLLTDL